MRTVGIRALKQNASEVAADSAAGELITITDRGRPVAQLIPLSADRLTAWAASGTIGAMTQVRAVLGSIAITTITTSVFERAGTLAPSGLRSLDALHLAAALEFGDELRGIVTYDDRLADAAELHGIIVAAPGAAG